MRQGYFVTGTGTGVGKTVVSCALLHAFGSQGKAALGMKPVAAGMENGKWMDVELLMAASNVTAPRQLVNPYSFVPSIAPHIAAGQADMHIDIEVICNACLELQQLADIVIVEGIGGFLVPLNERQDGSHMAQALGLPAILVVGMQLGCLNHALLTKQALHVAGLTLAGWVANCVDSGMQALHENVKALEKRLECPLLGVLPFQKSGDFREMQARLDIAGIGKDGER